MHITESGQANIKYQTKVEQVLAGGDKRRSGVASGTLTTAGLSGMEQRGSRRWACDDGRVQDGGAIWRRGGVDGSEAWHGSCNSSALKMD